MQFPHTYFEDEVREGFYVSGIVKRAWAAQLEVLEEVDKVCKKYNIRWFADCGTLLGAIRHGGYIPWDDDLDICMLRADYIRFNEIVEKELPEGYVVLNLNKEEHYFEHLTRVASGHRLNFDDEYLEKYHDFPYAVGIDIFPIDYVADDEEEEEQRKALATMVMAAGDELQEDNSNVEEYKEVLSQIEELCNVRFDYSGCIKQQLFQTAEKLFSIYAYKGGKNVALMPYWIYFDNHLYPAEYFDKTIMVPFENIKIPAPAAYDGVLRIEYGDYMKLVKTGGVHGYPFFTGQEEHLRKLVDPYPFDYHFDEKALDPSRYAFEGKPGQQAVKLGGLMVEAHKAFELSMGIEKYDEVIQLLVVCQNSAIRIGTVLEEYYGEGFETVKILETYCELLYQIGELVESAKSGQPVDIADVMALLDEITEAFLISATNNIHDRKEVLFITNKASHWSAFDEVWRREMENEDSDVYVMPVPYYSRSAGGGRANEYYEGEDYPDYLEIIDYRKYNIKNRYPDVIYIQNPYDGYNYTTCTAPEYFSSNLRTHTEKLIYIPWFKLDEPEDGNEKAKKVMEYYCSMPGPVNADVTYVQSEATRAAYIECLTDFAGEVTRAVWEEKIKVSDITVEDTVKREALLRKEEYFKRIPESWKKALYNKNGERKKILLYNTNIAVMVQYGVNTLEKIRTNLNLLECYQDNILLIWRPHPLLIDALEASHPELKEEYISLVTEYCDAGWGIYDDTQDSEYAINICDAYYGDSDSIAHTCETMKKPVMIQNVNV